MPMLAPRRLRADPAVFLAEIPPQWETGGSSFGWLGEADRLALEKMRSPRRKAHYAAGRWLLHYAAREAFGERYRVELADGRPIVLAGDRQAAASLSHSGNLALCGLARSGLLGVDVEQIRPRRDWDALARRVLHPLELKALAAASQDARWQAFYRCWTLKEALAKALGVGLALPFDRLRISERGVLEEDGAIGAVRARSWRFEILDAGTGFAAALAWSAGAV